MVCVRVGGRESGTRKARAPAPHRDRSDERSRRAPKSLFEFFSPCTVHVKPTHVSERVMRMFVFLLTYLESVGENPVSPGAQCSVLVGREEAHRLEHGGHGEVVRLRVGGDVRRRVVIGHAARVDGGEPAAACRGTDTDTGLDRRTELHQRPHPAAPRRAAPLHRRRGGVGEYLAGRASSFF